MMRWVRAVISLIVLLLLVDAFLVGGVLVPYRIAGCSMSPTLRGTHVTLVCPKCHTPFCVETDLTGDALTFQRGICPACSFAEVPVSAAALRPGDRVLIDRATLSLRQPKRWENVVFRKAGDSRPTVKRIVALPGEQVEIKNGDIHINGTIAVKPFDVQREMRIPVLYGYWEFSPQIVPQHETWLAYRPERAVPYFSPLPNDTKNNDAEKAGVSAPASAAPYHWPTDKPKMVASTQVTNQLCENQWRASHAENIRDVNDLMLELDWFPDASTSLCIRANHHAGRFDLVVSPSEKSATLVKTTGQNGKHERHPLMMPYREGLMQKIEVSFFDRQLLLAVDGNVIFSEPLVDDEKMDMTGNVAPFLLRLINTKTSQDLKTADCNDRIRSLKIWRDVDYTECPDDVSHQGKCQNNTAVPNDSYFVLGDNCHVSLDSRVWQPPCVPFHQLLGIARKLEN
ncbi:MAG: S26 family signal peptidase [Planctomycetaceae bacterium]|nr:S26 family signal peptidase [Planctomycetaceae bacterium]